MLLLVHIRPGTSFQGDEHEQESKQEQHHFNTHAFSGFHIGLRSPGKECRYVGRYLIDGRLCAIRILNRTIHNRRWHGDLVTRVSFIIVHSVAKLQAFRWVRVTGK